MLGIVTEKVNEAQAARKDLCYHVSLLDNKVAVFADAAHTAVDLLRGDDVERALTCGGSCDAQPPLYVTPVHVLADAAGGEGDAALHSLLADIERCVYRRENVTVIHRGANADAHLDTVLLSLLRCVRPCAEYAMQVVADEMAKERQIQRLLQLEGERDDAVTITAVAGVASSSHHNTAVRAAAAAAAAGAATATTSTACASSLQKRRGSAYELSLPPALRCKMREMELRCDYAGARDVGAVVHGTLPVAAAEPFVVLSDAHSGALVPPCTRGTQLVPWSFVANAPLRRGPHAIRSSLRERSVRSNSYLFAQQRRRSTLALMNELTSSSEAAHTYAPLKGNGWGNAVHLITFNGVSSVMALPGIPHLEDLIRCFAVDFWLRTDLQASDGRRVLLHVVDGQQPEDVGQLLQISYEGSDATPATATDAVAARPASASAAPVLRMFVRDSTNRVLEALVSLKEFTAHTSNVFHHIMLTLHSVDEGKLTCMVDGNDVEVRLVQQEHPIAFNAWPHRLFVGGYLDTNNNPACVFRGSMLELRFWSMAGAEPRPIVRWPLLTEDGKLNEATHTIAADHHATLLDLQHTTEAAPPCCPLLDGNLVINVGTMPLWGQLMHNWRVEVRFRTTVTTRMMTLMGVTDHKLKMQSFGVVLNAEPVLAKERFRFHELNTTLYVVDAFGACCSALLRGNERQSLVDGQWHTLVWKCVDSEANKFAVTVDGVPQDLLYVTREGATRFVEWSNWICIGGHNERNWRVRRPFTGQIDRVFVSLRGHHYLTLPLDEGPGAYVVQDRTCHGNHGLLVDPHDGAVRRNNIVWLPTLEDDSRDDKDAAGGVVMLHRNNKVSVAAVVFTCDMAVAGSGTPREVVVDVLSDAKQPQSPPTSLQTYYTLDTAAAADDAVEASAARGVMAWAQRQQQQQQQWYVLPETCYRMVDTATQLEAYINEALGTVARVPGHVMVVVRIGDCHVTLLHLREPPLPADATYDRNMLAWHYRYAMVGAHGWHTRMLRRMVEDVERVLVADTLTPMLVARRACVATAAGSTAPDGGGGGGPCAAVVLRRLREAGRPWLLCAVMHTHLLNTTAGSRLRLLYRVHEALGCDEAAAVALFACRLYASSQRAAATVLQRAWRAHCARVVAAQRARARQARQRRLEEIRALRLLPAVQAKKSLYALVIKLCTPVCRGVAPLRCDTHELEEALRRQGYDVHVRENVMLTELLDELTRVPVYTSSCFVHVVAYGGAMQLREPPLRDVVELQLHLREGVRRAALEHEAMQALRALLSRHATELAALLQARSRNALDNAKSKKKKKTKAAAVAAGAKRAKAGSTATVDRRENEKSDGVAAGEAATNDDSGGGAVSTGPLTEATCVDSEHEERDALLQDETAEWQRLTETWQHALAATEAYVRTFTSWHHQQLQRDEHSVGHVGSHDSSSDGCCTAGAADVPAFIYPCECDCVEPYASAVASVDAVIDAVMHRHGSRTTTLTGATGATGQALATGHSDRGAGGRDGCGAAPTSLNTATTPLSSSSQSLGLQCVLTLDLQPLTPYSCGMACLASSLGHVLRVSYKPEQRLVLTRVLRKAFEGHVPHVASVPRYAELTGAIAVASHERNWHAFAMYVMRKLHVACDVPTARQQAALACLQRELPFVAELVPVRDIVMSAEQRERLRRDREAQKVTVQMALGVGSTKVQSDMFALFKSVVADVQLADVTFTNVVYLVLAHGNRGIDGLCIDDVVASMEQSRPLGCTVPFAATTTAQGVRVAFAPASDIGSVQKAQLTQWLGNVVVRSLGWQFVARASGDHCVLEVEYVEFVYTAKATCNVRRYRQLLRQWGEQPLPQPYVRFLVCDMAVSTTAL